MANLFHPRFLKDVRLSREIVNSCVPSFSDSVLQHSVDERFSFEDARDDELKETGSLIMK